MQGPEERKSQTVPSICKCFPSGSRIQLTECRHAFALQDHRAVPCNLRCHHISTLVACPHLDQEGRPHGGPAELGRQDEARSCDMDIDPTVAGCRGGGPVSLRPCTFPSSQLRISPWQTHLLISPLADLLEYLSDSGSIQPSTPIWKLQRSIGSPLVSQIFSDDGCNHYRRRPHHWRRAGRVGYLSVAHYRLC
jgi:hypothetical protein